MASKIQQFFKDHGISDVEAIIPDMAGVARGKIMPAEKFAGRRACGCRKASSCRP
jgi:glutamine synthetase